jgi:hypothetical protein
MQDHEFVMVLTHDQKAFDKQVEAKLKDGWTPLGGISVSCENNQYTYALGLTRPRQT